MFLLSLFFPTFAGNVCSTSSFIPAMPDIYHDPDKHLFTLTIKGETAHVSYRLADGALDIRHTVVPPPLEGQGIASTLVKAAYDYARNQGLTPVATCSYAVRWLQRHPEYQGVNSSDYAGEGTCAL